MFKYLTPLIFVLKIFYIFLKDIFMTNPKLTFHHVEFDIFNWTLVVITIILFIIVLILTIVTLEQSYDILNLKENQCP